MERYMMLIGYGTYNQGYGMYNQNYGAETQNYGMEGRQTTWVQRSIKININFIKKNISLDFQYF